MITGGFDHLGHLLPKHIAGGLQVPFNQNGVIPTLRQQADLGNDGNLFNNFSDVVNQVDKIVVPSTSRRPVVLFRIGDGNTSTVRPQAAARKAWQLAYAARRRRNPVRIAERAAKIYQRTGIPPAVQMMLSIQYGSDDNDLDKAAAGLTKEARLAAMMGNPQLAIAEMEKALEERKLEQAAKEGEAQRGLDREKLAQLAREAEAQMAIEEKKMAIEEKKIAAERALEELRAENAAKQAEAQRAFERQMQEQKMLHDERMAAEERKLKEQQLIQEAAKGKLDAYSTLVSQLYNQFVEAGVRPDVALQSAKKAAIDLMQHIAGSGSPLVTEENELPKPEDGTMPAGGDNNVESHQEAQPATNDDLLDALFGEQAPAQVPPVVIPTPVSPVKPPDGVSSKDQEARPATNDDWDDLLDALFDEQAPVQVPPVVIPTPVSPVKPPDGVSSKENKENQEWVVPPPKPPKPLSKRNPEFDKFIGGPPLYERPEIMQAIYDRVAKRNVEQNKSAISPERVAENNRLLIEMAKGNMLAYGVLVYKIARDYMTISGRDFKDAVQLAYRDANNLLNNFVNEVTLEEFKTLGGTEDPGLWAQFFVSAGGNKTQVDRLIKELVFFFTARGYPPERARTMAERLAGMSRTIALMPPPKVLPPSEDDSVSAPKPASVSSPTSKSSGPTSKSSSPTSKSSSPPVPLSAPAPPPSGGVVPQQQPSVAVSSRGDQEPMTEEEDEYFEPDSDYRKEDLDAEAELDFIEYVKQFKSPEEFADSLTPEFIKEYGPELVIEEFKKRGWSEDDVFDYLGPSLLERIIPAKRFARAQKNEVLKLLYPHRFWPPGTSFSLPVVFTVP